MVLGLESVSTEKQYRGRGEHHGTQYEATASDAWHEFGLRSGNTGRYRRRTCVSLLGKIPAR